MRGWGLSRTFLVRLISVDLNIWIPQPLKHAKEFCTPPTPEKRWLHQRNHRHNRGEPDFAGMLEVVPLQEPVLFRLFTVSQTLNLRFWGLQRNCSAATHWQSWSSKHHVDDSRDAILQLQTAISPSSHKKSFRQTTARSKRRKQWLM